MSRKQARFGQPAVYNATPPTLSDGDDSALNVDSSGNLNINVAAGSTGGTQYAEGTTTSPATGNVELGRYSSSAPTLTNGQLNAIQLDVNGNQQSVGNVASGTTDSGAPIKVGGIYNSTLPTFTTGQRGDMQLGSRGSLNVTLFGSNSATAVLTAGSGADSVSNSSASIFTTALNAIYNGTTWDRLRSGGVTGMLGVSNQASPSGGYSFNHQSANGTTTIKSGSGTLHTVTINNAGTTDTITLYDNTAGSGTIIAVIGSSSEATFTYDIAFSTGLTAVIAGTTSPDVTFSYK